MCPLPMCSAILRVPVLQLGAQMSLLSSKATQFEREQQTSGGNLPRWVMVPLWRHQGKTPAVAGSRRRRGPAMVCHLQAARDHSLSAEKKSNNTTVAWCLPIQTFGPRRLYGVGASLLGGIGADAIVKSSTNLQNSVSLNSRILAYAATMRSARTRAWRSRQRCVISMSAMLHKLPCGQPPRPRD